MKSIASNPECGSVIPGSGGIRKMRWSIAGRGKRGGPGVIHFLRARHGQIWMLTLYPENVAVNIPPHVLRRIKDEIDG